MKIEVNNLYQHANGDYYCLLSDDAPIKCPATDAWLDGVIYTGTDGKMRSTAKHRWDARFSPVAEYTEDDEQVLMMIRRTNPGGGDLDYLSVFESWHESEMGITGHMLELAVAACMESFYWGGAKRSHEDDEKDPRRVAAASIHISTADLQRVLQSYEIERVPVPHGFTFRIARHPK